MSRSAKKGFYVEESLFKKVEALNAKGDKQVIKPGPEVPQSSLNS